jgi:hypothetical protein
MKRIATVFACALAIGAFQAHNAEAQTIGFKLGQSWSKLDVDPQDQDETLDMISAFGGGGFIRFGFAGLAMQAEVLALTKGTKEEDEGAAGDAELKLEYIEVPVTVMFGIGNGPYVFAGPSFAFETGCEQEDSSGTIEVPCETDADPDAINRKKFDVGVTGGIGFQFPAGPGSILIEGRYTHGLTNLNDSATSDAQKIRNRSFAAYAGYAIPLGSH